MPREMAPDRESAQDERQEAGAPEDCGHPTPFSAASHGHKLDFLPDGAGRYAALLELIESAQHTLHLFYYMFQDDESGAGVLSALVASAERGVDVQLIVDRFGTDAGEAFFRPLRDVGGSFALFNPRWSRRYLIRNHQKMAIADGKTALVGGFNVSDHYFAPPEENGWCDLGVRVEGPVVEHLLGWYRQIADWIEDRHARYRTIRTMVREWDPGDSAVRMLVGGPTAVPSNWARQVKADLRKASRLDLVMAYFSPPLSFRRLIRRISKRGQARLVLAGKSDNTTTISAARALYGALLRDDCQIYEFRPSKLHMKVLVIDDAVYFGSANFDHRSIRLNLELMFRFEDAELASQMRALIDEMAEASEQVTYAVHCQRRGFFSYMRWLASLFLVSALDYTVTRRLNLRM
ncbi:phospholipase D-like domain-containing protein [Qipengyuania sp. DGS5-3]|uniref:phospholipase D-like domain-containing protein n=1 Tax=Qipengyuania sp. DGS5-3 TaxID=3349632 RepID=UPI0036D33361